MCGTLWGVSGGDGVHNENKGSVNGPLVQAGAIYGGVTTGRNAPADESLAQDLAGVVGVRSREEEEHWRIGDPVPLRVRWHEAETDLFDDWDNIHRDQEWQEPVPLSGQFTAIRETFQATGSRRLVILGRAGAGKTVLAHRLILDLLDARGHRGPVPVLFSLNDWNPATTRLREWMIDRLVRDFSFLGGRDVDATGKRGAEVLVDRDWIMPVLDGFDELPDRRHSPAICQISQVQLPLLLTSRPREYAQAARATQAIGRAAAIELDDLTLTEAEHYLCRSTTPNRVADWEAVFEQLRTAPQQTASWNLTPVLTTPLMIMLARVHYEQPGTPAPGELLDTAQFFTSTDLEQHLLDSYVDTLYAPQRPIQPSQTARPAWTPNQSRHWLGYLASRLHARDTHDFTWWQLPALIPGATRFLATTATVGLAFGLAFGLASELAVEPDAPASGLLTLWVTGGFTGGLPVWLAIGLAVGLAVGTLNEAGFARRRGGREPERLRPYRRRRSRPQQNSKRAHLAKAASEFTNGLVGGLALGFAGGLAFGLMGGLADGLVDGLLFGLMGGLPLGLALGVALGVVNVVVSVLGEGLDPHDSDPWQLLSTDRTVTLTRAISAGLPIASLTPYAFYQISETNESVFATGFLFGLLVVLLRLALSGWGNWLLFVRVWLPLTGRLPWRPLRFLQDAHDRGMLRRVGAAYQFRHAQLRDHLAENHPGKRNKRRTTQPS